MSSVLIDTVRSLVTTGGMSRSGLARAAGLHANSLRRLGEGDWNPTAETLGKLEAYIAKREGGTALASPEEIINEARNGRMFILVDDEDRENEGDLVIPAQMATPDAINFMATHGRGLICLALTKDRVDQLGLDLMSRNNGTRHETAFTVSIEARKTRADIVTPGHVFPLIAKDGGVLVRTGHTEAAVDVSRLAGLNPSGVICEVMKDDGTMARLDDLIVFAQKHKMKIGTIRDLIAYRRRHDHMVERRAETTFESQWGGNWKAISFYNKATGTEQLVLQKGHVTPDEPTLVRMHQLSLLDDVYGAAGPRSGMLAKSMEIIAQQGSGVIVVLTSPSPSDFVSDILRQHAGQPVTGMDELRDYGVGAQILAELGVHDMVLLSNSHHSLIALDGYDLAVVGQRAIEL
jgi:3,4-dihydroxy 2-butanone 4-phosphate synthase/GTP cyclohydrolase II